MLLCNKPVNTTSKEENGVKQVIKLISLSECRSLQSNTKKMKSPLSFVFGCAWFFLFYNFTHGEEQ